MRLSSDAFGGLVWIIIVIIGSIISTARKAKKKQQEQANRAARSSAADRPAQPVKAPSRNGEWINGRWVTAEAAARPASEHKDVFPTAPAKAAAPAHQSKPLEAHMHTPVMGMEGEGTEGIDCCHEYMLDNPAEAETPDILPLADENAQDRAAALLQGVIFSEILGRRNTSKRYGGRRA